MKLLRRLFVARIVPTEFEASLIQVVLTIVGVFVFLAGVLYLPSLNPTSVQMILALLLLAAVALLCTAVGQLTVVLERLGRWLEKSNEDVGQERVKRPGHVDPL
jgi:hypothetical protein